MKKLQMYKRGNALNVINNLGKEGVSKILVRFSVKILPSKGRFRKDIRNRTLKALALLKEMGSQVRRNR